MRQFVVDSWDSVMNMDRNPLKNIPDIQTRHLMVYHNAKLTAYARLLPAGLRYPEVSIGRIAVESSARHRGIGSRLMTKCLEEIQTLWPNNAIRISAQEHLKDFYQKFGFNKVSDSYLEDGIPHIEMVKEN